MAYGAWASEVLKTCKNLGKTVMFAQKAPKFGLLKPSPVGGPKFLQYRYPESGENLANVRVSLFPKLLHCSSYDSLT